MMKKTLLLILLGLFALGSMAEKNITLKTGAKMKVYLPEDNVANGRAVVLCPGGGYSYLADANEGTDWAPYFNELGYAVAVLYYRMPQMHYTTYPLEDVTEAVLYLRRKSDQGQWNLSGKCVGVMGFSAGGHVASTLATHATTESGARPDFQILFYPVITMDPSYTHMGSHDNLLGVPTTEEKELLYSNEKQVTDETPVAFITYASDDSTVPVANSTNYATALAEHGVSAYTKAYLSGGHGFGWYKASFAYHDDLLAELTAWLNGLDEVLPNGVEEIPTGEAQVPLGIYTLDGRAVGKDWNQLPEGVYVRDGEKTLKR